MVNRLVLPIAGVSVVLVVVLVDVAWLLTVASDPGLDPSGPGALAIETAVDLLVALAVAFLAFRRPTLITAGVLILASLFFLVASLIASWNWITSWIQLAFSASAFAAFAAAQQATSKWRPATWVLTWPLGALGVVFLIYSVARAIGRPLQ